MLKTIFCEGGSKGKHAEECIRRTFQFFFKIGVKTIEAECNKRREELLEEWRNKDPNSFMVEYGLPNITYEQGILESTPPFDLYEPDLIEFCMFETLTSSRNLKAAMEIRILDETGKRLRLHVYLTTFEEKNGIFHWKDFCMSMEEVLFHELLHACGDAERRGRRNGIIRPNIIGITAIKSLLQKSGC